MCCEIAWDEVCATWRRRPAGSGMDGRLRARHGGARSVVGYEAGMVRIEVADAVWLQQMISLRSVLEREMARIAGLKVARIEFERKAGNRRQGTGNWKGKG